MWWLESHAAERAKRRVKSWYGHCLVATYAVGQVVDGLSYEQDGYTVICIPAFEIIPTFPFPKFWTKKYWQAHKKIRQFKADILITRTRFFISSFFGGVFSKIHRIKRVHIEHGVGYVKMNARWKEYVARCYDQLIGRLLFRWCDKVIAISNGCKSFAQQFTSKEIPVIYRWVEFHPWQRVHKHDNAITLWYVWRLTALKWLDTLLHACKKLFLSTGKDIRLEIVWNGEEKESLEKLTYDLWLEKKIAFLWYKEKAYLEQDFYPHIDICVNVSRQEWLPTSVIEALLSWCVVVATNVWGTAEITSWDDLLLCSPWNIDMLVETLQYALETRNERRYKSQEHVLKKFLWTSNIQQYYHLLSA